MMINIEIGKSWVSDRWRIRVGDIQGSTESSHISKKELMQEIEDAIGEEDDGHDCNCEGSMCWCASRLRKDKDKRKTPSHSNKNNGGEQ